MDFTIGTVGFLLLVAAIVAMLARRLHLPYSIGLVLAGIGISLVPYFPRVQLSRELIFGVLLPPLVFEAALFIRWEDLRRNLSVVLVLATVGVLLSAFVTTLGLRYLIHWEWQSALVFSILIAATDPVSVIAIFKETAARERLRFLIEAESLFNDGTAAALFSITIALVAGGKITLRGIVDQSMLTIGGGVICGAAVAGLMLVLAGRTADHLVETTFTTIGAYGSFLLAEHFGMSGVLATVTAGLLLGNIGPLGALSERGRETINSFWEYAAFVANSLVFLLIGMNGAKENIVPLWHSAIVAILLVLAGRAAGVYLTLFPFSRSTSRVSISNQHLLVWGGLRGALALALVLGLPSSIPRRQEIITITFAVVAFSIFVQGLTVVPLLKRLGEVPPRTKKKVSGAVA